MGHKVGWLPLHAGVAGGADIILIPEIPYDLNKVVKKIKERTKNEAKMEKVSRFWQLQKVRFPKKMQNFPRKS